MSTMTPIISKLILQLYINIPERSYTSTNNKENDKHFLFASVPEKEKNKNEEDEEKKEGNETVSKTNIIFNKKERERRTRSNNLLRVIIAGIDIVALRIVKNNRISVR